MCKPVEAGGLISHKGTTEVVSSIKRNGDPVENHLQMGTYVVVEADSDYVQNCFEEYHMLPDSTRQYAAIYRPIHMIGLELGISVASVALRGEPTGCPDGFRSDVLAVAKKDLRRGEVLDGEGGYTVWGKQVPAGASLQFHGLPLGLSGEKVMQRDIKKGEMLRWDDVELVDGDEVLRIRKEMEAAFGRPNKDS